jgi:hypothetical protein
VKGAFQSHLHLHLACYEDLSIHVALLPRSSCTQLAGFYTADCDVTVLLHGAAACSKRGTAAALSLQHDRTTGHHHQFRDSPVPRESFTVVLLGDYVNDTCCCMMRHCRAAAQCLPRALLLNTLWCPCADTKQQNTRSSCSYLTVMSSFPCCVRCSCISDSQPVQSKARQCTGGDGYCGSIHSALAYNQRDYSSDTKCRSSATNMCQAKSWQHVCHSVSWNRGLGMTEANH